MQDYKAPETVVCPSPSPGGGGGSGGGERREDRNLRLVHELELKNAEIMREIARLRQNRATVSLDTLITATIAHYIAGLQCAAPSNSRHQGN